MSKSTKWYETFFGGLYAQVLAGQAQEERTRAEAQAIKKVLRLRKGQKVLDCPCGMGRIALALARLGLDVTGADLTASFIRRARRQAKSGKLNIPFVRCDMRELPFEGQFDAVVNWFTSFGYFDPAGNLAAAKAAFAALKPGGRFLVEILNKSFVLDRFAPMGEEQSNGVRIVRHSRWDADNNRIRNVWTMSKGKRVETHRFAHRLYNAAEMRSLLESAGFRDIRFFARPTPATLGRFTRHSRRMIAIGARP